MRVCVFICVHTCARMCVCVSHLCGSPEQLYIQYYLYDCVCVYMCMYMRAFVSSFTPCAVCFVSLCVRVCILCMCVHMRTCASHLWGSQAQLYNPCVNQDQYPALRIP